ncbi:hypothetical protein [Streptomyces sp. HUAS TT7]|uniref:hypothetical protein n=1 Tax=Streptomyces sp. HUAS TT7 TaxID=3447507 RepID=UPI003F65D9DE
MRLTLDGGWTATTTTGDPATRLLLTQCLDLVTTPLLDATRDRNPAALARRVASAPAKLARPASVSRMCTERASSGAGARPTSPRACSASITRDT